MRVPESLESPWGVAGGPKVPIIIESWGAGVGGEGLSEASLGDLPFLKGAVTNKLGVLA